MTLLETDEQLKITEFGGVCLERSAMAFASTHIDPILRQQTSNGVFAPTPEDIARHDGAIREYTRSGRVKVLIPLREFQENGAPLIGEIMSVLCQQVGQENIFIVDNGIHPRIRQNLLASGVTLISPEAVRQHFNWSALLGDLNLSGLDSGKGYAVMIGLAYLALNGLMHDDDWLVQCDGDITRFGQYQMIPHLFYPVAADPAARWEYLKMAKVGRNNETTKAGINGLAAHFQCSLFIQDDVRAQQAQVARELYDACIHHIWMLSGEFALRWHQVVRRMGASGYCEEVLISAQHGWRTMGQTLNPNPRLDRPNSKRKEDIMMIRIVQFLNALVVFGRSLRSPWSREDVRLFNQQVIPHLTSVAWLPEQNGPVQIESFEADRIIPSVATLLQTGVLR